jgi:hypothetical protein
MAQALQQAGPKWGPLLTQGALGSADTCPEIPPAGAEYASWSADSVQLSATLFDAISGSPVWPAAEPHEGAGDASDPKMATGSQEAMARTPSCSLSGSQLAQDEDQEVREPVQCTRLRELHH